MEIKNRQKIAEIFSKIGLGTPQKIIQMTTGACSKNFYVKTEKGTFLIKWLIKNYSESNQLFSNLSATSGEKYCPDLLYKEKINDEDIFVFRWIEGKNIFLEKLSVDNFKKLILAYNSFSQTINKKIKTMVFPGLNLKKLYEKIKGNAYPCMKTELKEVEKDLNFQPDLKIIHGDLNYKNCIFNQMEFQTFLDFQDFSFGCPTEDLIRLLLTNAEQHNFIRTSYTLRLLTIMMENTHFSEKEWLYGLNIFVLEKYRRKLRKRTLKNRFSAWHCTFLYEKIRKTIQGYYR